MPHRCRVFSLIPTFAFSHLPGSTQLRIVWKDPLSFLQLKLKLLGVSVLAQRKRIQLVCMRMRVQSLASLSRSGIRHCHELQCRSQRQLRSGVAVAVVSAGSCSSDWTPSLGTSICCTCGPKKQKINK